MLGQIFRLFDIIGDLYSDINHINTRQEALTVKAEVYTVWRSWQHLNQDWLPFLSVRSLELDPPTKRGETHPLCPIPQNVPSPVVPSTGALILEWPLKQARFLPALGSTVDTYNPWTLLEKLGNPTGVFTYESRLVENTVCDGNYPGLRYLNDAISSLRKSGKPIYHSVKQNILHMLNFSLFEFLFESRKDPDIEVMKQDSLT